jgi:hypothetical protein
VWLKGDFGNSNVHYVNLTANTTRTLEVPLSSFGVAGGVSVSNVGVGLFQVPQFQYVTLFVDDVGFSCVKNGSGVSSSSVGSSSSAASGDILLGYEFSNVEAWSDVRESRFLPNAESEFSAAYSQHERDSLISRTNENFLVSELEYLKIENTLHSTEMTAKKSRKTWYDNLYSVVRNRLRENVVANPKQLFFEAEEIAAESDYTVIPLLVADLDYAYSSCSDSLCSTAQIMNAHLLTAGLPTSFVRGSKIRLLLDPYFVVTKQRELPSVSICLSGQCSSLKSKESLELEFPSAGLQKIVVKLKSGGRNVEQNLFVEVK